MPFTLHCCWRFERFERNNLRASYIVFLFVKTENNFINEIKHVLRAFIVTFYFLIGNEFQNVAPVYASRILSHFLRVLSLSVVCIEVLKSGIRCFSDCVTGLETGMVLQVIKMFVAIFAKNNLAKHFIIRQKNLAAIDIKQLSASLENTNRNY